MVKCELTGKAYGDEATAVVIELISFLHGGVDLRVTISLLSISVKVETFVFGFNLSCWCNELAAFRDGRASNARFYDCDEMLILEIFKLEDGTNCLSIANQMYGSEQFSGLPSVEVDKTQKPIAAGSAFDFALNGMRLDSPVEVISDFFVNLLRNQTIEVRNPYS